MTELYRRAASTTTETPTTTNCRRVNNADQSKKPIEPEITSRDGDTTDEVDGDVRLVVTVSVAPGAPIVTSEVLSTGTRCYKNPSTAEQRRNRC